MLVQTLAEAFADHLFIFVCGVSEGLECVINSGDDDRAKGLLPFRSPFFSEVVVFLYVDLELVPEVSLNHWLELLVCCPFPVGLEHLLRGWQLNLVVSKTIWLQLWCSSLSEWHDRLGGAIQTNTFDSSFLVQTRNSCLEQIYKKDEKSWDTYWHVRGS